jgi:CRP-like cAMP-binding protein
MSISDVTPVIKPPLNAPGSVSPRTDPDGKAISNSILLSIPDEEFIAVRPHLEPTDMPRYRVLYELGEKIEHAYFPNQGMISLVVVTHDAKSVEVGIVGRGGVVGVPLAFGFDHAPTRAIVQLPGSGLRISSAAVRENFEQTPYLRGIIERYVLMQQFQVAQIAACNRLHDIEQRLARWLLMCQDSVNSEILPLTHEFLAQMLGSGRPSVTIAAGVLERAGLIANSRGRIKIANRKQLEVAACECYGVIQNFSAGMSLG